MKRLLPLLAIVLTLTAVPAPALAFVPRAGDTVTISDAIRDDVYAAGQRVTVMAPIDGDLVAAAQNVTVNAPVTGAVMAAGETVDISDRVGRSVRAAGRRVTLSGTVGTDALLFGATVRLTDSSRIGRDLVALGARIRQEGTVGRDAVLAGNRVTIAGTITGNVRVDADTLVILATARITGKLTYSASQEVTITPGAQIAGGVERVPQRAAPRRMMRPAVFRFSVFGLLVEILWLLVLGVVALAVSTRGVLAVSDRIKHRFGMSLLAGFVLAVIVPICVVLLLITIVGIPLGGVAILLYLATLYPSNIFVGAWIGDSILTRARRGEATPPSPYLAMFVGVAVLALLGAIPVAGWIIRAVAVCAGFGALWGRLWETRSVKPLSPSGGP